LELPLLGVVEVLASELLGLVAVECVVVELACGAVDAPRRGLDASVGRVWDRCAGAPT
jgi:hypothetical protein